LQLQINRALMENRLARRELETGFIILRTDGAWRVQSSTPFNLNAASNGKLQSCDNLLPPECDYALMIQWHPASGEVIYKCQGNQEKQPNYPCYDYQMQKAAAFP
jgi:hypothetical protein